MENNTSGGKIKKKKKEKKTKKKQKIKKIFIDSQTQAECKSIGSQVNAEAQTDITIVPDRRSEVPESTSNQVDNEIDRFFQFVASQVEM